MTETLQYDLATVESTLRTTTEAAAVAVGDWIGAGDGEAADGAAVDAMHRVLSETNAFVAEVVIGEGEKDEAPMLTHEYVYGSHDELLYDLAVDPLDGTTVTSKGFEGGIATIALAEAGAMPKWNGIHYMRKFAVGAKLGELMSEGEVGLQHDPTTNFVRAAHRLDIEPHQLKVAILDRPRNQHILDAAAALKINPVLLNSGDIIPALLTSKEGGNLHMLYSSGGSPEAVLAAAGVAALGGNMQAMWDPQNEAESEIAASQNQLGEVLDLSSLVGTGETHFVLTAVTSYQRYLRGCRKDEYGNWQPGDTWYFSRPAA